MASDGLKEDGDKLGREVMDQHRAIVSLMEELEAVDWYNQRAKATSNPDLRAILEHNRDEEKEHASMVLEWLRRSDPKLMQHLKTFLFTEGPITEIEAEMAQAGASGESADGISSDRSLCIGRFRLAIENVAQRAPRPICGGPRLVDFRRRRGRDRPELRIGCVGSLASPDHGKDVQARLRRIQPLVELGIPFEVTHAELHAIKNIARVPV